MTKRNTIPSKKNEPATSGSHNAEATRAEIVKILKDAPERALRLILEFSRGLLP